MAKKIRLGNDIQVTWTLTDGAGNAYDLTGRNVEVYLLCYGWQGRIEDFSVGGTNGNVITFTFWGKDQIKAGSYTAVFIENRGEEAMVTYDASDIFTLVHHSREANGEDGEELETQNVNISSSATQGIIGPQGLTGNGIADIEMNDDYTLTITMTDGTSYTTEPIRGPEAEITAAAIAEALGYTPANAEDVPAILFGTTAFWDARVEYIPPQDTIIVYTDKATVDGVNVPGIKIGSGNGYVQDLAFVADDIAAGLYAHIQDDVRHITAEERAAWNNKLNVEDVVLNKTLVFTRN